MKSIWLAGLVAALLGAGMATAQDRAWVQVEAQPTLDEARDRARALAERFEDVEGFRLGSRWYGIVLGPQAPEAARDRLRALRAEGAIPRDSYVTDGSNFREQFWPPAPPADAPDTAAPAAAQDAPAPQEAQAPPAQDNAAEQAAAGDVAPPIAPALPEDETPEAARAGEQALTRDDRIALQEALQWGGFYTAALDGAFGPGTRAAMRGWQEAKGLEPTGILTTGQRARLLAEWQAEIAAFGFTPVTEAEAGIDITLPLNLVAFDHYEPPFVHFVSRDGSGLRVILISQPGDRTALDGLYDLLQGLEIVPPDGERTRSETGFTIRAEGPRVSSHATASLSQGLIKGFLLVWEPQAAAQAQRVLAQMEASFRPVGNRALDPGMAPMTEAARQGLLSGLELRRPAFSRSGFYVDAAGAVVTVAEAVASCGRVTLDGVTEAEVIATDPATGLALLRPRTALAPPVVAAVQQEPDRVGSEIAVAGYAYEDSLPAAVVTYGRLEAVTGLEGEPGLKRLGISTRPGDAGGPVIDGTGAVLGMLLPRQDSGPRRLPPGVEFAASAEVLAQFLLTQGISAGAALPAGALAPEDLMRKAMGMTVLVGCWE